MSASGSFEEMRGNLLGLGFDLVEGLHDRRHADRAGARSVSAHAELHLVGIAVHDDDVIDRNAEAFGHQLREGRLVALSVLMAAGQHFNGTRRIDAHFRGFHNPTPAPS